MDIDYLGWVGNRVRIYITGVFKVPGENVNGRKLVDFCAERELCVSNIYFEYKSLHYYTTVPRGQDGVEVKIMIDLFWLRKI